MTDTLLGVGIMLGIVVLAGLAYRHGWNIGWQCGVRFGEQGRVLNQAAKTKLDEGDAEVERLQARAEELKGENAALMRELDPEEDT